MPNRYITLALFGLVLLLFTIYFTVQSNTFPAGQPLVGLFAEISADARLEQWSAAVNKVRHLEREWEKRKYLLMFNYAEADYQTFENTIYRLTAAVEAKNKDETISCARIGQELWRNFQKIIPEP